MRSDSKEIDDDEDYSRNKSTRVQPGQNPALGKKQQKKKMRVIKLELLPMVRPIDCMLSTRFSSCMASTE